MRLPSAHGIVDRGEILVHGQSSRLLFNGEAFAWPQDSQRDTSAFVYAFYGSRQLFGLVAGSIASCWAFYGAAVQFGTGAIALVGRSGIGKTTLVLELMARGAALYSDECVFLEKTDGMVDGLPRALMIRESSLEQLASIPGVAAACRRSPFHVTEERGRLWYAIDPTEIFDAVPVARPSPLRAFVVLDDERSDVASLSSLSPSVAAAELARRCHGASNGIAGLAIVARRLSTIPCYRLRLGTPRGTADLLEQRCGAT